MTPERCPGCGTKLSPEMLACPNCPMSFPEDDGASTGSVNPLKQSPYWNFVLPALFFLAIGAGIWYIAIGLFHLGEESAKSIDEKPNFLRSVAEEKRAALRAAAEKHTRAPGETSEGAVFEPAAPDGGPSSAAPKDGETAMISISPVEPAESGGREAPPAAAAPPVEWKLRGHIYDLETLKPLAGVSVEFIDEETNSRRKTRTGADGLYRVIVPVLPGRGYTVTVSKGGYSPNYLDASTRSVADLTAGARRALAQNLTSTLSATPVIVAPEDSAPLVTDFYLARRP